MSFLFFGRTTQCSLGPDSLSLFFLWPTVPEQRRSSVKVGWPLTGCPHSLSAGVPVFDVGAHLGL